MALYEYHCSHCGASFEKRMSMNDVLQLVPCTSCGKQAQKVLGGFAVVGRAAASVADGPAPWEAEGGDDGDAEGLGGHSHDFGHSHDHGHGHSHGPGGHTH
jgi:putative FmdB family regulatory protein